MKKPKVLDSIRVLSFIVPAFGIVCVYKCLYICKFGLFVKESYCRCNWVWGYSLQPINSRKTINAQSSEALAWTSSVAVGCFKSWFVSCLRNHGLPWLLLLSSCHCNRVPPDISLCDSNSSELALRTGLVFLASTCHFPFQTLTIGERGGGEE